MPAMLSNAEIIRRLRIIRHSPRRERNARRAPSMNGIATAAGISRELIHKIVDGTRRITPRSAQMLSNALTCVQVERERAEGFPPPTTRRPG